ncbi:MAG: hypothetical protein ACYSOI_05430, partial [Planctomycetota bacterium]
MEEIAEETGKGSFEPIVRGLSLESLSGHQPRASELWSQSKEWRRTMKRVLFASIVVLLLVSAT